MIFVIDIGNTQIVVGLMDGSTRKDSFRLATDRVKTAEEYALLLQGICSMRGIDLKKIEGGILSSVVPVLTPVLQDAIESLIGRRPLAVGAGVKTGLNLRVDNPGQLGSDRVVDAVAASAQYKKPIFIVDMGTSTTVSVVGRDGSFLGGMIIPGLRVSVDALSAMASQLPLNISLETPDKMIGTNTLSCMRSGVLYGAAAMLDGLVTRVEKELGEPVTAVATGGLGRLVVPLCRRDFSYDPDLLLKGLQILYRKKPAGRGTGCLTGPRAPWYHTGR